MDLWGTLRVQTTALPVSGTIFTLKSPGRLIFIVYLELKPIIGMCVHFFHPESNSTSCHFPGLSVYFECCDSFTCPKFIFVPMGCISLLLMMPQISVPFFSPYLQNALHIQLSYRFHTAQYKTLFICYTEVSGKKGIIPGNVSSPSELTLHSQNRITFLGFILPVCFLPTSHN